MYALWDVVIVVCLIIIAGILLAVRIFSKKSSCSSCASKKFCSAKQKKISICRIEKDL